MVLPFFALSNPQKEDQTRSSGSTLTLCCSALGVDPPVSSSNVTLTFIPVLCWMSLDLGNSRNDTNEHSILPLLSERQHNWPYQLGPPSRPSIAKAGEVCPGRGTAIPYCVSHIDDAGGSATTHPSRGHVACALVPSTWCSIWENTEMATMAKASASVREITLFDALCSVWAPMSHRRFKMYLYNDSCAAGLQNGSASNEMPPGPPLMQKTWKREKQ